MKDVREVAVTRVSELERQIGEIDPTLAQPFHRYLKSKGMAVAGQRLPGEAAEGTAEPPRCAPHRA